MYIYTYAFNTVGYICVHIFNQELESNLKLPRNILEIVTGKQIWSIAMSHVVCNYVKGGVCDIWLLIFTVCSNRTF